MPTFLVTAIFDTTAGTNVRDAPSGLGLTEPIRWDLGEKMVFVGGPRQVGKSTLRLSLIPGADGSHPAYPSWDVPEHKRLRVSGGLPAAMRPAGKSTFVLLRNGKSEFALECKTGDLNAAGEDTERTDYKARILPFVKLAKELKL